ncbi:Nucleoside diphosphate kinase 6 [Sarcoptes scabiei]|nr:Nucleoside diphosphate kinase 6 [Sarcoptes scabiei]
MINKLRLCRYISFNHLKLNQAISIPNQGDFEYTLAIIKPHICKDPSKLQEIQTIILREKFLIVRSRCFQWSKTLAEAFYGEHQGKFFFDRLVAMMTSGHSIVYILAQYNAVTRWRQLIGPTKVFKTILEEPKTIRGSYGLTDTRNAAHGSDSSLNALKEIKFFFPQFQIDSFNELRNQCCLNDVK